MALPISNQINFKNNLKVFLKNLSESPGIYQMLDSTGKVIYVGKAKNLKKRVSSYFNKNHPEGKTRVLVGQIENIEIIITQTESEALILENNLIKKFKPRYNIIFRDDKSYPYLYLSKKDFPELQTYRGIKKKSGQSFGPYPSFSSTREMKKLIQKIFLLRDCSDSFFANRSRPCLQYQIGRCSAPCVGKISQEDYLKEVEAAALFLNGKNSEVLKSLSLNMQIASENLNFELAMKYRNQIGLLNKLQADQAVETKLLIDADILELAREGEDLVVSILFIRQGRLLGNKNYFNKINFEESREELLENFIKQIYCCGDAQRELDELILDCENLNSENLGDLDLLDLEENFFSQEILNKISPRKNFKIINKPRSLKGLRRQWVNMAKKNAQEQLTSYLIKNLNWKNKFESLKKFLDLSRDIKIIECIDISHHQGESTVGSCVVFNQEGPDKKSYRKFNIEGVISGDDYGAIEQVVLRRFKRLREENLENPDVVLIDGGQGQLRKAYEILIQNNLLQEDGYGPCELMGISKGPDRKVGMELLWRLDNKLNFYSERLNLENPAFNLLQNIRDEAHRFAITGHRKIKNKTRSESKLEDIPGIGPKRRKALLNHFGSMASVLSASLEELCKVEGISRSMAEGILKAR